MREKVSTIVSTDKEPEKRRMMKELKRERQGKKAGFVVQFSVPYSMERGVFGVEASVWNGVR